MPLILPNLMLSHDYDWPPLDQIRPDWEAKLAAVRAAVARRANRRIIMRQVGDRLIPVGVTSGRLQALANGEIPLIGDHNAEGVNENEGRSSRRSRRRHHQQPPGDLNNLLGGMGLGGQDLEEASQMRYLPRTMKLIYDCTVCCPTIAIAYGYGSHAIIFIGTRRTTA